MGNILHIGALGLAPASLLGPVNAANLLMTLWLAISLLEEPLTPGLLISTALTIIGILLCIFASIDLTEGLTAGASGWPTPTWPGPGACWTDPIYLSFWLVVSLIICFLSLGLVLIRKHQLDLAIRKFNSNNWLESGIGDLRGDELRGGGELDEAKATLLSLLAGICGSQTVCEIKEIGEQVNLLVTDPSRFTEINWIILAGAALLFVAAAACQFPLLSAAVKESRSAIIPTAIYQVSWCIFSVVGAGIKFEEYKGYTLNQIALFFTGVGLTATATWIAILLSVNTHSTF